MMQQVADARRPVHKLRIPGSGQFMPDLELSGRAVVETPGGEMLSMIGTFSGGPSVKTALTFTVPTGPFRIAIYGQSRAAGEPAREFVIRSMLLTGAAPAPAGPEPSVHHKLTAMLTKFASQIQPEDAAALNMLAQLKITGESGGQWWISTKDGKVGSGEGAVKTPDLTLTCADKDALALCTGDADPMSMLADGRLSFSGDVSVLRKLVPLFKRLGSE